MASSSWRVSAWYLPLAALTIVRKDRVWVSPRTAEEEDHAGGLDSAVSFLGTQN